MRLFLSLLSGRQGDPLNLSEMARKVGTTSPTLKNYLQAFEALFLIRELGSCYYFEDQRMASFLNSFTEALPEMNLRRFLFAELQQQLHYRLRSQAHLECYQPRRGVPIPFIFTAKKPGRKLAIIAIESAYLVSQAASSWSGPCTSLR